VHEIQDKVEWEKEKNKNQTGENHLKKFIRLAFLPWAG
jgi:hypothetical protein